MAMVSGNEQLIKMEMGVVLERLNIPSIENMMYSKTK